MVYSNMFSQSVQKQFSEPQDALLFYFIFSFYLLIYRAILSHGFSACTCVYDTPSREWVSYRQHRVLTCDRTVKTGWGSKCAAFNVIDVVMPQLNFMSSVYVPYIL